MVRGMIQRYINVIVVKRRAIISSNSVSQSPQVIVIILQNRRTPLKGYTSQCVCVCVCVCVIADKGTSWLFITFRLLNCKDYYKLLGVSKDFTEAELKKKYKKVCSFVIH